MPQKSAEPIMGLLVNHTKPINTLLKNTVLKLISFNSGQLQNNSVNGTVLITTNRVVKRIIYSP